MAGLKFPRPSAQEQLLTSPPSPAQLSSVPAPTIPSEAAVQAQAGVWKESRSYSHSTQVVVKPGISITWGSMGLLGCGPFLLLAT